MRHASIRFKLTLWYGAMLAAILIAFSIAVYVLMRHHMMDLTDSGLAEELTELTDEVSRASSPSALSPRSAQHEGYELQVSDASNRVLFRGDRPSSDDLPIPHRAGQSRPFCETVVVPHLGRIRLATRLVSGPQGTLVLQVATTLQTFDAASRELTTVLCLTGIVAVGVSIGVGYLLARKALAPVDLMVAEAAEITATRLDRRLDVPVAGDELARLARTLNDMIERLERSFARVKRFTADAAHELRTPLTVIRTSAELALRQIRSPERDARVLEDMVEEVDRLSRIVSQLLDLCREEHGIVGSPSKSIRLDELTHEVTDLMQVAADEKGVRLAVDVFPPCQVCGDEDRLRQLLINLLDNAIKYTPAAGSVHVLGSVSSGSARVEVADTGSGISQEHLPHIFERFYRADAARGRETEGTGLGLSICRSIVEAHGGQLGIKSEEGRGTQVTFSLPCKKSSSR